jgi:hypothetical protein
MMYVQRQLGHADIGTTIRKCGHLEESFLIDAAERAEAAIFRHADTPRTLQAAPVRSPTK